MISPDRAAPSALVLAGLLALCAVLYFAGLGVRDLWEPDETRYALIARTMLRSDQYVLPHLNGRVYPEKPPLFFWTIAAASRVFGGLSAAVCRVPSAVSAILLSLLTLWFAWRLFGARVGVLAGVFTASAPALVQTGRWVIMDPMLSLFMSAAICLAYLGFEDARRRLCCYAAAGLAMGLGSLIKGPIAILMPALVVFAFAAVGRQARPVLTWRLLPAALIALAIPATWYAAACNLGGPEYTRNILFHQSVGRFAEGWIFREPWYYYGYVFPALLLPWSLFLPSGIAHAVSEDRKDLRRQVSFLLVWIGVYVIFFSLSKSKKPLYVLPTLPPVAMIVALLWDRHLRQAAARMKGFRISLWLVVLFLALLTAGLAYGMHRFLHVRGAGLALPIAAAAVITGLGASAAAAQKMSIRAALGLLLAAVTLLNLHLGICVCRRVNPAKSTRPFTVRAGEIARGKPLATFRRNPVGTAFFTGRDAVPMLASASELREYLRGNPDAYVVASNRVKGWQNLRPPLKAVLKSRVGDQYLLLLKQDRGGALPRTR